MFVWVAMTVVMVGGLLGCEPPAVIAVSLRAVPQPTEWISGRLDKRLKKTVFVLKSVGLHRAHSITQISSSKIVQKQDSEEKTGHSFRTANAGNS